MSTRSDSASWRINGERLVVLGWPSAILMQFAHPLVAAGVAQHSSFQKSHLAPLARLRGTVQAMLALTFGDDRTAAAAAERINRIHDRVNGTLSSGLGRFPPGTPYSAHDPHLLAWVQLTLLDTMPRAYELLVGPLTAADKDAYCLEGRRGARLLGIPDALVPERYGDVAQLVDTCLRDGSLAVSDTARALARDILSPRRVTMPWPAAYLHRLIAVGLLPAPLRQQYGLSWSLSDDEGLARWGRRSRRIGALTPALLRRWRAARTR